jgi:hypothetical protein
MSTAPMLVAPQSSPWILIFVVGGVVSGHSAPRVNVCETVSPALPASSIEYDWIVYVPGSLIVIVQLYVCRSPLLIL